MVGRVQELSIEEYSRAFISHQRLPQTCRLVLVVLKDKRRKRSDALVKMYPLRLPRVRRVDDQEHVSDLLEVAKSALSTDVEARGWKLQLHDADGLVKGNRRIKSLRREDDSRQAAIRDDEEIEMLLTKAEGEVWDADAMAQNAEVTVPRAYLRALISKYSPRAVRQALQDL